MPDFGVAHAERAQLNGATKMGPLKPGPLMSKRKVPPGFGEPASISLQTFKVPVPPPPSWALGFVTGVVDEAA